MEREGREKANEMRASGPPNKTLPARAIPATSGTADSEQRVGGDVSQAMGGATEVTDQGGALNGKQVDDDAQPPLRYYTQNRIRFHEQRERKCSCCKVRGLDCFWQDRDDWMWANATCMRCAACKRNIKVHRNSDKYASLYEPDLWLRHKLTCKELQ